MNNLIKYCCEKGLEKFIIFKIERKSKMIMIEHFISNEDVKKYNLYYYVHKDQFGRYKLSKYVSRKLSNLISDVKNGFIGIENSWYYTTTYKNRFIYWQCHYRRRLTIKEVEKLLLKPNEEIRYTIDEVEKNIEKDLKLLRSNKLKKISNIVAIKITPIKRPIAIRKVLFSIINFSFSITAVVLFFLL